MTIAQACFKYGVNPNTIKRVRGEWGAAFRQRYMEAKKLFEDDSNVESI